MATESVVLGYSQQQASTELLVLLARLGFIPGPYMKSGSIALTFGNGVVTGIALTDPVDTLHPGATAWGYKIQPGDIIGP